MCLCIVHCYYILVRGLFFTDSFCFYDTATTESDTDGPTLSLPAAFPITVPAASSTAGRPGAGSRVKAPAGARAWTMSPTFTWPCRCCEAAPSRLTLMQIGRAHV